jgi:hypothetical protein
VVKYCTNAPVKGRDFCRKHGGSLKIKAGTAHPAFKHGMYARDFPRELRKDYEDWFNDPARAELEEEMATLFVRLRHLRRSLTAGDYSVTAKVISEGVTQLRDAITAYDVEQIEQCMSVLEDAANAVLSDKKVWGEIGKVVELATYTKNAHHKREHMQSRSINAQQGLLLQAALVQILRDALYDPRIDPLVAREIRNMAERRIRELGGRAAAPALPVAALEEEMDALEVDGELVE